MHGGYEMRPGIAAALLLLVACAPTPQSSTTTPGTSSTAAATKQAVVPSASTTTTDPTSGWVLYQSAYHYSFRHPAGLRPQDFGGGVVKIDPNLEPGGNCAEHCEMFFQFSASPATPQPTPNPSYGSDYTKKAVVQDGVAGFRYSWVDQGIQFAGTQFVEYDFTKSAGNWSFQWKGKPSSETLAQFDELIGTTSFTS
jgi:hypothetical protein